MNAFASASSATGALETLKNSLNPTWTTSLEPDPETEEHAPNRKSRQVKSGHFVLVDPTPLPAPRLVMFSPEMAQTLGFSEEDVGSEEFARLFSGDVDVLRQKGATVSAFATPYALSIMGERYTHNCPFGNGNGYGDGRAISIGEVLVDGKRWEMQLKGAGKTPFCRGADGRAVLRSSIREFLASEAMFHLGVDTTRALSLVVSQEETVRRAWYSQADRGAEINENDPRLAALPEGMRKAFIERMRSQSSDPDTLILEPTAITCRVAPSFLRVGHIDLFSRRVSEKNPAPERMLQLEQIVEHALFREYPELSAEQNSAPLQDRVLDFVDAFAEKLSAMVAGWLRVGFAQGNFNADNCLVGGRTMDYGPFGWIEKYDPFFAKWTGSGRHFGFMMQPNAGYANFHTLVSSLAPLFDEDRKLDLEEHFEEAQTAFVKAVDDVWRRKFGFPEADELRDSAGVLFKELEPLLRDSSVDYTIFWRNLAKTVEAMMSEDNLEGAFSHLDAAFYEELDNEARAKFLNFLESYKAAIAEVGGDASVGGEFAERMRRENPKYVLREWMLVEAYDAAGDGDESKIRELFELIKDPYGEQPDMEDKYFVKAPSDVQKKGGVAFMT